MTAERFAAPETENVLISKRLLRAGQCAVAILPELGGKIASIRVGDQELLQVPLCPIAPRTRSMSFEESDASGWDECLPSVAPCGIETESGFVAIPDHGDLWRVEWEEQGAGLSDQGSEGVEKRANALTLTGKCFSLPLELERRIELSETGRGWRLALHYELRNTGEHSVAWSWAAHPLFRAEEGDRILLPESVRTLRLEGSAGGRLGQSGDTVEWPIATLADGSQCNLSVAKDLDSGIGDKLFAGPLQNSENWCVFDRASAGVRIRVEFDGIATPYLGLWICFGGWPERPGPKQVCVALEPSTAPVDSLAISGPWTRTIAPGEVFSWPMQVEIERRER